MPLDLSPAVVRSAIVQQLDREKRERMPAVETPHAGPTATPLHPGIASVAGAGLDAASTYRFMKQGAKEDNVMASKSPAVTAAIGAATGPLLYLLMKRKFPKLAEMWGAQVGGHQMGLGALNLDDRPQELSSHEQLDNKLNPAASRR